MHEPYSHDGPARQGREIPESPRGNPGGPFGAPITTTRTTILMDATTRPGPGSTRAATRDTYPASGAPRAPSQRATAPPPGDPRPAPGEPARTRAGSLRSPRRAAARTGHR